jgi:redox-sensitive bicupin YhaK (pirin superfamily)
MLNIIPSDQRHQEDFGWLQTRWHFSFGDYYDPKNMNFGPLRVFNDDVVQPGKGFDMHPHRDMEIVTYVLDGQLEHKDSAGNRGVVHPGEIQVMTAGKGILHSEYNPSNDQPVRLQQRWIMPRHKSATPHWGQTQFSARERLNRLLPVVVPSSGDEKNGAMTIDQDATIYVSKLEAGSAVMHIIAGGRRAYLFIASGSVTVNGQAMAGGDQARVESEHELKIRAEQDAEILMLDLP